MVTRNSRSVHTLGYPKLLGWGTWYEILLLLNGYSRAVERLERVGLQQLLL